MFYVQGLPGEIYQSFTAIGMPYTCASKEAVNEVFGGIFWPAFNSEDASSLKLYWVIPQPSKFTDTAVDKKGAVQSRKEQGWHNDKAASGNYGAKPCGWRDVDGW